MNAPAAEHAVKMVELCSMLSPFPCGLIHETGRFIG